MRRSYGMMLIFVLLMTTIILVPTFGERTNDEGGEMMSISLNENIQVRRILGSSGKSNHTLWKSCDPSKDYSAGGLYVTISLLVGIVIKIFLIELIPIPYTVVMLLAGFAMGSLAYALDESNENIWYCQSVYIWISLDPHTLLYTFLPALIFASAHRVEYITFLKELPQILTYATLGSQ